MDALRRAVAFVALLVAASPALAQTVTGLPQASVPATDQDKFLIIQNGQARQISRQDAFQVGGMLQDASNAELPVALTNLGLTTVYAANYGVVADRVDVAADMSIGAGSTVATTLVTTFSDADVGKLILVYTAGTGGYSLSTTIAAVTGPKTITLANAAVTSAVNAGFEYGSNPAPAMQVAANASAGKRMVLPAGKYLMRASAGRLNLTSGITLDGENAVDIRCDDTVNAPVAPDNSCIYGNAISQVTVRDSRIKGMLDINRSLQPTLSAPLMITGVDKATMTGMEISWTRANAAIFWQSKHVFTTLNRIHNILYAGIDISGVDSSIISMNEISYCDDNPIAVGVGNAVPSPSTLTSTSVVGNIITECWSTSLTGAKAATFSNNLVKRSSYMALYIAPFTFFDNGDTPLIGVTVTGNVFLDLLLTVPTGVHPGNTQAYMVLNGAQRQAGSAASVPGYPAVGTGTVTDLYGTGPGRYWTTDTVTPTIPSPGGGVWTISDNVMMRTLPAVTSFNDYGLGTGGWWTGMRGDAHALYTGAVTDAELGGICMRINGPIRNSRISGNICNTTADYGILFSNLDIGPVTPVYEPKDGDFDGLTISKNKFYDYKHSGILINTANLFNSQVIVDGNEFNADPRFVSANRGAGGTWAASIPPFGINNQKMSGMFADNNHFRNLVVPIASGGGAAIITAGPNNTIYGVAASSGFSTSNVGVGSVSETIGIQGRYKFVTEDGDPASATFGQQIAPSGEAFVSIPTTGSWLRGTTVWKVAPTLDATNRILLGWSRLTTSSNNVDGVDWKAIYSAPVTAAGGLVLANTVVASLPTCNGPATYTMFAVSDATAPVYGAVVVGLGAAFAVVVCNGVNWIVH